MCPLASTTLQGFPQNDAGMIKTYERVDPRQSTMSFALKRMEDIYAERGGEADEPHRHDFYTVLMVEAAEGWHRIDFQEYALRGGLVFFLAPGQVHQIREERPSKGCVVSFSSAFLVEHRIDEGFLKAINIFRPHGDTPPLEPAAALWEELQQLGAGMETAFGRPGPFHMEEVGAWLKLFLLACNRACRENPLPAQALSQTEQLVSQFKELVDQHFEREHLVAWYAERLHVTPDHLNRTVKSATGRSAKQFVQARLALAARRLLLFTDFSAKEIGYELGFADPAHFSHFFKRLTGESPAGFREQNRKGRASA